MKKLIVFILLAYFNVNVSFSQGTPTMQFKTVAAMVAFPIPVVNNRLTALVMGRNTENDGGGGLFNFAGAGTTNIGTIFPATGNSGRWYRQFSGSVNIRWFGAKADGNDDTVAIQAALNSLPSGGSVLVPTGVFTCEILDVPSNISVTGTGTLKYKDNTAQFYIAAIVSRTNVSISGITFDGNIQNQSTWNEQRHALIIHDGTDVTVNNVKFVNLIGDGIYASHPSAAVAPYTGTRNLTIAGCEFSGTSSNRNAISLICVDGVNIEGNTGNAMARIGEPGFLDAEPDNSNEFVNNVTFRGNKITGHNLTKLDVGGQTGVSLSSAASGARISNFRIIDNDFIGNFHYPIHLNGNSDGLDTATIFGNHIANGSWTSQDVLRSITSDNFQVKISGNTIENMFGSGIWANTGKGVVISGNLITNIQKQAIVIGSLSGVSVCGNRIVDAGKYNSSNPDRAGIYFQSSSSVFLNNEIISNAATNTLFGFTSTIGTNNYFQGNYFFGVGTRNFNISGGAQIFGINYPATAGTDSDLITRSLVLYPNSDPTLAVLLSGGGYTAGHSAIQFDNGAVRMVKGDGSAYAPMDAANISGHGNIVADALLQGSGFLQPIATKSANYTVLGSDHTILVDSTSGNITVTLPSAANSTKQFFVVKKVSADGNSVSLVPASGLIDGAASKATSTQWDGWTVQSNGTNYYIIK